MPQVLTVTPNPALDVSAATDQVRPTSKLRCSGVVRAAGGGGVNVSRVLHALGVSCHAVFPQGGTTGALLQTLLSRQGVSFRGLPVAGLTRESFNVADRSSGLEYRFVLPGPKLDVTEAQSLLSVVREELQAVSSPDGLRPQWLVVSGSLPPGVSLDFYESVAEMARNAKVRLVVDAGAESLRAALAHKVFLAKPSLGELRTVTGRPLKTLQEVVDEASALIAQDAAQVLLVSLGAQGALLVSRDCRYYIAPLNVPVRSAVGAGDSLVAGFVAGLSTGRPIGEAFRFAVACASASLGMAPGMQLDSAIVQTLYDSVGLESALPTEMQFN